MDDFNLKLANHEQVAHRYVCHSNVLYSDLIFLTTERFVFTRQQKRNVIASVYFIFAKSQVINEIHLKDISGVSSCVVKKNRALFTAAVLIMLQGIVSFIIVQSWSVLAFLMLSVTSGFLVGRMALRDSFLLELFSSSQTNDAIAKGQNNRDKDLFYSVTGDLTRESNKMLFEIGANISNLQLLGTEAI